MAIPVTPKITIDGQLIAQPTSLLWMLQFFEPLYRAVGMTKSVDASGNITWASPAHPVASLVPMLRDVQASVANVDVQTKKT